MYWIESGTSRAISATVVPNIRARQATSSGCESYKACDVLGVQQEKGTHYCPSGNLVERRASLRYVGSLLVHDCELSQDMGVHGLYSLNLSLNIMG